MSNLPNVWVAFFGSGVLEVIQEAEVAIPGKPPRNPRAVEYTPATELAAVQAELAECKAKLKLLSPVHPADWSDR